jgi:hypothetical protein
MATRKPIDDVTAREAVETLIENRVKSFVDDIGVGGSGANARAAAKGVTDQFRYVETETTVTKVGGSEVALRRFVLTTDWEVNRNT